MEYLLITGASSGVGREIAVYLSRKYNLIIAGRNEERLLETKEMCSGNVYVWTYDLSDVQNLEYALTEYIARQKIEVGYFVHCAGVMKMLPLRSINLNVLNEVYSVNVYAPLLMTKVLSSKKINSRNLKSVIYISSNISNRGAAAFATYGSSKSALDGVMRNLAVELAPNVRVNSILPGGMITEMTKEIFEDETKRREFEKNYPLGIGTPCEIATVVEFLLSDKSRWMTGQQIAVDGGRTVDITERS